MRKLFGCVFLPPGAVVLSTTYASTTVLRTPASRSGRTAAGGRTWPSTRPAKVCTSSLWRRAAAVSRLAGRPRGPTSAAAVAAAAASPSASSDEDSRPASISPTVSSISVCQLCWLPASESYVYTCVCCVCLRNTINQKLLTKSLWNLVEWLDIIQGQIG